MFGVNRFVNGGQNVSNKQSEAFKETTNTIYQGVGSGSIIPGGGGLPNSGMKPSTKGLKPNDVITIEGRKYVVLEDKNNDQYLVMDINGVGEKPFNLDKNGQQLDKRKLIDGTFNCDTCNSKYENSNIDVLLENEYLKSLPQNLQNAIVTTLFSQEEIKTIRNNEYYSYGHSPSNPKNPGNCTAYYCLKGEDGIWRKREEHTPSKNISSYSKLEKTGAASAIQRKVFLPFTNEIINAFNMRSQKDVDNVMSKLNTYVMGFRDSCGRICNAVLHKTLYSIETIAPSLTRDMFPAFVVDLTKISYKSNNEQLIN